MGGKHHKFAGVGSPFVVDTREITIIEQYSVTADLVNLELGFRVVDFKLAVSVTKVLVRSQPF